MVRNTQLKIYQLEVQMTIHFPKTIGKFYSIGTDSVTVVLYIFISKVRYTKMSGLYDNAHFSNCQFFNKFAYLKKSFHEDQLIVCLWFSSLSRIFHPFGEVIYYR